MGYKLKNAVVFYIFLPISRNFVTGDKHTHKNGLSEHKTRDNRRSERQRDVCPGRQIATPDSVGILYNRSAHKAFLIMKIGAGKTRNEISPIFSVRVARYR